MPPKNAGKRQRSKARTQSLTDDGASDSAAGWARDRKKVRWKAKAPSTTAPTSSKRASSRSSRGRTSTVRSTADDSDSTSSNSESENEEEDELAGSEKTCLAAFCSHGRVGFAYYDPLKGVIHVLEDTQETGHFDLTRMQQVCPDFVLTSSKSEDDFIDVVRDHVDSAGGLFQIRPFKEFNAKRGRERLISLTRLSELPCGFDDMSMMDDASSSTLDDDDIDTRSRNAYEFMQKRQAARGTGDPNVQRWNAVTRLANFANAEGSPYCMASIGALLDHLVRERAASDYDDDGIPGLDVRDIHILDQVMHINADALLSLQVFEPESHASVHSDKTKEGLSLFGVSKYSLFKSRLTSLETSLRDPE
ncbi:hypothetical protein EST38_g1433 [Candolleomyces aberdarensis]|uniref:MutS protein homolog 3 n=1 Tax=Candolleomyces aberdarensis TaxID=2316362 RepID=A0A4V1Q555_9AGAR|nr:hypothetical protein EST38_g1433 [Candolleomyces aberdarensis]